MFYFSMILAAAATPYLGAVLAKSKNFKLKDNHNPREFLLKQTGAQQRANWAQQNSFEAFPAFAAAVIVAHLKEVPAEIINPLAITFVVARVLYIFAYVFDLATIRSLIWFVGVAACVALFVV